MASILRAVRSWLAEKKSVRAMEIGAWIVIHAGTRSDADVLLAGSDDSPLAAEIVADSRYAISRRGLT